MYSRLVNRKLLAVACLLVATLAIGCNPGDPFRSTGSYPIDIFQEMHYNQTLKAQEPPRFLPAEGSIPIEGGLMPAPVKAEAADLTDPFAEHAANRDATLTRAALLYKQNCSSCHGLTALGDGAVGQKFVENGAPQPPALNSQRVASLTPGEAYASITHGIGFMPPFQLLITDEERWVLVALVELDQAERASLLERINTLPENERTVMLAQLRGDAR